MAEDFDVILIGSGFGGSVMAARLTEAGKKVLVLERGHSANQKCGHQTAQKATEPRRVVDFGALYPASLWA